MVMPVGGPSFGEALRAGAEIFTPLRGILKSRGPVDRRWRRGRLCANLKSNREAIEVVLEAIGKAGMKAWSGCFVALDVASSELWAPTARGKPADAIRSRNRAKAIGRRSRWSGSTRTGLRQTDHLHRRRPREGDWDGWKMMTQELGNRLQIVGDDVFVTNPEILKRASGTVSATRCWSNLIRSVRSLKRSMPSGLARSANYATIISHRSGETEDTTIADLAWAPPRDRSNRLGEPHGPHLQYNQLLRIEEETGPLGTVSPEGARSVHKLVLLRHG